MEYLKSLFNGRIGRRNYLYGLILPILVLIISDSLGGITSLLNYFSSETLASDEILASVFILIILLAYFFYLSLAIRRLHDMGKSGWISLLGLIPFISLIVGIALLFNEGASGENKYGPIPNQKLSLKAIIGK